HEIDVQGAPILRIHRIDVPADVHDLLELGRTRNDPRAAAGRFATWLDAAPPELHAEIDRQLDALAAGDTAALQHLADLIPERLHRDAAFMLSAPPRVWRR